MVSRRQVQPPHDCPNHKDRSCRRLDLRRPAGCCRRCQRSPHRLRRMASKSLPIQPSREERDGRELRKSRVPLPLKHRSACTACTACSACRTRTNSQKPRQPACPRPTSVPLFRRATTWVRVRSFKTTRGHGFRRLKKSWILGIKVITESRQFLLRQPCQAWGAGAVLPLNDVCIVQSGSTRPAPDAATGTAQYGTKARWNRWSSIQ